MYALTIHQPYASMIAAGIKRVEYRSWRTHHRGPLLIHAATKKPWDHRRSGLDHQTIQILGPPKDLPRGAIVAYVKFVNGLDHSEGGVYYGWKLSDIRRIEPIPCTGQQRLWNVPAEIEAQVKTALMWRRATDIRSLSGDDDEKALTIAADLLKARTK